MAKIAHSVVAVHQERVRRFDGTRRAQIHRALSRIFVELEHHIHVIDDLRDHLRGLRIVVEFEGLDRQLRFISPTARTGAVIPRQREQRSRSAHD